MPLNCPVLFPFCVFPRLRSEYVCTKRKDLVQAMIKFATTTVKGEVSTEVLAGSVRTAATLAYVSMPSSPPVPILAMLMQSWSMAPGRSGGSRRRCRSTRRPTC